MHFGRIDDEESGPHGMALRGNLRDFSLPDVFQLVTLSGKSGVLRIKRADAEGSVWFRDGEVFFAQSDWHREALGTRLVAAGKITPSALTKALDLQKAEPPGGRRLGQILVDEGYLTDKVLEAFVQEQIQDTIFDLFRWDEGDFDFESAEAAPEEDIGLSVSIENIVMEGSRRLEEWTRIKKKIPSMGIVFKMATAPGEGTFDISLKPVEWHLLLKIDGTRTVAELARELTRTDFEVARIIYGLFSAGLLEVASDEEVERLRAERIEMEAVNAAEDARRAKAAPAAAKAPEPAEAPVEAAEHVVEEPAFLSGERAAPSADDMAVFEQMMGAVLEAPQVETPPALEIVAVPEVVAEPEVAVVPEIPVVPEPAAGPEPTLEPKVAVEPEITFGPEVAAVPEITFGPEVAAVPEVVAEPEVADEPGTAAGPEVDGSAAFEGVAGPDVGEGEAVASEAPAERPLPAWVVEEEDLHVAYSPPEGEAQPSATGPEAHGIEDALLALGAAPVFPSATETVPDATRSEEEIAQGPYAVAEPPLEDLSGLLDTLEAEYAADGAVAAAADGAVAAAVVEEAAPEQAEEEVASAATEPRATTATGDFATDLMALGLGELPHELAEEPALDEGASGGEAEPTTPDVAALSELLSSLGDEETDQAPVAPTSTRAIVDEIEVEPIDAELPSGVISTDAFLADFDSSDVTFSAGMGDEITALTGGGTGRARPTASATKVSGPDAPLLHRDSHVDRDLLMRIIDGVKKL